MMTMAHQSGDSHALSGHYAVMAASRRCWKGMALDGSADDERAPGLSDGGLLGVRSVEAA